MEYVEGILITEYCRGHQSTLKQRLRFFRNVCAAVQYAHEHAVIHRDLKPSNILVKADGEVRLLDFAIAKQLSAFSEPVEQTRTLRLLTPAYAAPEQLRSEAVGAFTDVYALGAILYELLAGRTPFDLTRRSPTEAERMIIEAEPEKPSQTAKAAPFFTATRAEWADLDVLCLKAIHKDAQGRYRSAEALTRDVDRFLENEPLEARPESTAYKLRKFLRRNRRPTLATAAVLLLVVSLVTFFLIRLTRARNEALAQAERSERIKHFMQHLFDTDAQSGPSIDLRAVDVLDRGVQEARRLDKEPAVEGELLQMLGDLYDKLAKFDRAALLLNSALSIRSSVFGKESEQAAETLVALGSVRGEQGKYADALQLIQKGLAIETKVLKPSDFALGSARMEMGRVLASRGNYKEAIAVLGVAVQSLSRRGALHPICFDIGLPGHRVFRERTICAGGVHLPKRPDVGTEDL
jgi:serine/threonine-protein kinase